MTILGIAGCAALTLTGFGLFSSISVILEKQYTELFNYDLIVSLDTDSSEEEIGKVFEELDENEITVKNLPAHIMSAQYEGLSNISLVVAEDSSALEEMVLFRDMDSGEIYHLSDEGVIITERFSEIFELSPGDEITFYSEDTEFTAKITAADLMGLIPRTLYRTLRRNSENQLRFHNYVGYFPCGSGQACPHPYGI